MANRLKPSPQLVGLAKFGAIPGLIISIIFCIAGIFGIFFFLGEYQRTNQQEPVVLLIAAAMAVFALIGAFNLVTVIKFLKMNPKDISLHIDSKK